jgi:hypothetical protein
MHTISPDNLPMLVHSSVTFIECELAALLNDVGWYRDGSLQPAPCLLTHQQHHAHHSVSSHHASCSPRSKRSMVVSPYHQQPHKLHMMYADAVTNPQHQLGHSTQKVGTLLPGVNPPAVRGVIPPAETFFPYNQTSLKP